MDILNELYETVTYRKNNPEEGSYTCYLFAKGLDKILKKCGEECSETIIAAKNKDTDETVAEISDLLYHLTVLMVELGINPTQIGDLLEKRSLKTGNLKKTHNVNKDS